MRYGISTACFYSEQTEIAAAYLAQGKIPTVEIFLNSFQEMDHAFAARLKQILGSSRVVSIHPFSSEMETMLFFTDYMRRWDDGLELYKRYFSFCNDLGAKYLIFHGVYLQAPIQRQRTFERFAALAQQARRQGIVLLQENVARCKSGTVDYIREMKSAIGSLARFALDIKQCLRAGVSVDDMLDAMGESVRHVHVSDHDGSSDCLPPGDGSFDFGAFSRRLQQYGFSGSVVIELYHQNYSSNEQLFASLHRLETMMELSAANGK